MDQLLFLLLLLLPLQCWWWLLDCCEPNQSLAKQKHDRRPSWRHDDNNLGQAWESGSQEQGRILKGDKGDKGRERKQKGNKRHLAKHENWYDYWEDNMSSLAEHNHFSPKQRRDSSHHPSCVLQRQFEHLPNAKRHLTSAFATDCHWKLPSFDYLSTWGYPNSWMVYNGKSYSPLVLWPPV